MQLVIICARRQGLAGRNSNGTTGGTSPRSGRGGRRFKSCHSDQYLAEFHQSSGTDYGTDTSFVLVSAKICCHSGDHKPSASAAASSSPRQPFSANAVVANAISIAGAPAVVDLHIPAAVQPNCCSPVYGSFVIAITSTSTSMPGHAS